MHMILGDVASDYLDVHALTDFADQIPQAGCHVSKENRLAVFGDPHKMVLDVIYSMRGLAIFLHNSASLLKSSPEGEGFSPIPRWENKNCMFFHTM